MLPFIAREKPWPWPQIHEFNFYNAVPLLVADMAKFDCPSCTEALKNIEGKNYERSLFMLL